MRYPDNFKQDLHPEELAQLPEVCRYEGDAPDLQHLKGLLIPTVDVQRLVYVGERENIYVDFPDGTSGRPWLGAWITELDPQGKVIVRNDGGPSKAPPKGARTMSTAELGALGYTDDDLARMAHEYLSEVWSPDRPGPSEKRRALWERVADKMLNG